MRFLYDDSDEKISRTFDNKTLKVNYPLTVNDNYRNLLGRLKRFEAARDEFVGEILDSFDINDIKDYLTGYPRLGFDPKLHARNEGTQVAPFSEHEALSEVRDILYVEDMIRLFF